MCKSTDDEIIQFAKNHKLFAITMPKNQAQTSLPKRLNEEGIYVYTHTLNDEELVEDYIDNGVSGFYTDTLVPEGSGIKYAALAKENRIYIKLNGEVLRFISGTAIDGNTFIPIRKIFEVLGAKTDWNQEAETVIGYTDELRIELFINKDYAIINGEEVKLDAAPILNKENTMVPITFVAENLGGKVDWDQENSMVIISMDEKR